MLCNENGNVVVQPAIVELAEDAVETATEATDLGGMAESRMNSEQITERISEVLNHLDAKLAEQELPGEDRWVQEGILQEAQRITSGDRQRDYDSPLPNHKRIAMLWNAYLSARREPKADISHEDVAWMMILLKAARDVFTPKRDNLVDVCGYARCLSQMREYEP
jgi:hypothetical protein